MAHPVPSAPPAAVADESDLSSGDQAPVPVTQKEVLVQATPIIADSHPSTNENGKRVREESEQDKKFLEEEKAAIEAVKSAFRKLDRDVDAASVLADRAVADSATADLLQAELVDILFRQLTILGPQVHLAGCGLMYLQAVIRAARETYHQQFEDAAKKATLPAYKAARDE